jgi:hypothetical protein
MSHLRSSSDDEHLLGELREALAGSRHPDLARILARARAVHMLNDLDGELARLVHDSALEVATTDRRAATGARTLVFESRAVSVEIEVTDEGMVGQVVPPAGAELVLEASDGARTPVDVDELGCFTARLRSRGLVRLRVDAGGSHVVTEWADLRRPPPAHLP